MMGVNESNGTSDATTGIFDPSFRTIFALLGVLALLIFVANSFVIYLYLTRSFLRTKTNLCLVFFAVSDLLASLVVIPIVLTCNMGSLIPFICTASDLASRFVALSTILHLLLVSLERYIMIVFPMEYVKHVSKPRIIAGLAVVWCFSFTVILIQLSWIPLTIEAATTDDETNPADLVYSLSMFFGIVVPVFLLLTLTYAHTYSVIHRQIKRIMKHSFPSSLVNDQNRQARREKRGHARAIVIFALMLFTFVCGWFPYFILGILYDLGIPYYLSYETNHLIILMRFGTSLINPLLYTFLKTDFRRALRRSSRRALYNNFDTRQHETEL